MTVTTSSVQSNIDVGENTCKDEKKIETNNAIVEFYHSNWKAILGELVSTSILLLFGCMASVPVNNFVIQPSVYVPFAFGLVVLMNVHTFGHISGAHMNPAVTLLAVVTGITPIWLGITYVIVQTIGAILGYGILVAVSPIDLVPGAVCTTVPHPNQHVLQTIGIEIALTAVLCLVCCSAWDPVNKNSQDSMPLKFGFTIAGLSIVGGPITGASMNPVRTLAPAIWTGTWTVHWAYWVGPLLGSVLAAVIYWLLTPRRGTTEEK